MGVGKSMKIFTEAMQNSMKERGFGSKIVTTAMGPFKWDDLQEMWVNVNNGFQMPNISMQDLIFGYGSDSSIDGGLDGSTNLQVCYSTISGIGNKSVDVIYNNDWQSIFNLSTPSGWSNSCPAYFFIYKSGITSIANTELQFRYTVNSGSSWEIYVPVLGIGSPAGINADLIEVTPNVQFGSGAVFDIQVKPTTEGSPFTLPTQPDGGGNADASYSFNVISTSPQKDGTVLTVSIVTIETSNSEVAPGE